jgi:hypothetical protein
VVESLLGLRPTVGPPGDRPGADDDQPRIVNLVPAKLCKDATQWVRRSMRPEQIDGHVVRSEAWLPDARNIRPFRLRVGAQASRNDWAALK